MITIEHRKRYSTDLIPEQWAILQAVLLQALQACASTQRSAPRKYALYDLVGATLSVLVNGVRWRELPPR